MSEVMEPTPANYNPEDDHNDSSIEIIEEKSTPFHLFPYNPDNFPEGKLPRERAITVTKIKESLQDVAMLDYNARQFREVSTRGDYVWAIFATLGMTETELPTKSYREKFEKAHEVARDLRGPELGDLMDMYEDHPAFGFIDSIYHVSPKNRIYNEELVMLRRSMLVFLHQDAQDAERDQQ